MGEIADMILDGILDEETGEFIDDELSMNGGPGYPRKISKKKHYGKKGKKHVLINKNKVMYDSLPKRKT